MIVCDSVLCVLCGLSSGLPLAPPVTDDEGTLIIARLLVSTFLISGFFISGFLIPSLFVSCTIIVGLLSRSGLCIDGLGHCVFVL